MKILVVGEENRVKELQAKLPEDAQVTAVKASALANQSDSFDLVFDLNFDDQHEHLPALLALGAPVFLGAVKRQLAAIHQDHDLPASARVFGMNTLSTFINRDKVEVSLNNQAQEADLKAVAEKLGWEVLIVQDRVGMVTPRVIMMIINEACYTVQEGTASPEDIDLAMQLGTNYPGGPFQWAEKIGIKDVYETLVALYEDTKDERYKICPLLKTKYLKGEGFYH